MQAIKQGRYNIRYNPHRMTRRPGDCERDRPGDCVIPFLERIDTSKRNAYCIPRIQTEDHAKAGNKRKEAEEFQRVDVSG